ncbi:MAG TPA: serine/threonine-protein kinase [Blastocatellia bacterium]|nr:serine/threonine-protein kinase [Blastocatellia bacterium]
MTPERWRQAKALLEEALARDPAARAAWLTEVCKDDDSLRAEVESLIVSYEEDQNFMEMPAVAAAPSLAGSAPAPEGRMIGPYRLIREIGHGGMGTVFMAARADDQYRKRVAIKLVRRGMDSEQILARFRNERQILASLDHPNIARLLDGGTTDDGLPYFVMEYIEGQPIDRFCDEHKLTTAERLKLFRTACSAVHFAHQNLVVHRDLKPSNILVTPDGTPKLLDFGIAKLLKPELYAQTLAPTVTSLRPMTPDYASPEQVKGLPITTASDVYSLGVLLYELLSGHRPYQFKSYTPVEIEKVICGQVPDLPSDAATRGRNDTGTASKASSATAPSRPRGTASQLKGDLDNIILMALRKEPQRRYASVEQFAEDIRRHLEGLPVIARKDTFAYRAGKFVTRNKVAVSVALAFVLLLAVSLVVIVRQSVRAARERDKARQVAQFLAEIFKVSDPGESRGNSVTAREILDKGAERIDRELSGQPEVQATLMATIGQVYESLGLYDAAAPVLEKALNIRLALFGREHPEVAESMLSLAILNYDRSRYAEAEPLYRESLAIRRRLFGDENPATATSLNGLGTLLQATDRYEEAEAVWRQALAIRRKLYGAEHREVAESLDNLGWLLYNKGEYEEAERLFNEALATHRRLLGNDHPMVAADLNYLAFVAGTRGHSEQEQESLFREALEIRRKVYGNNHPQVAESLNNLAWMMNQRGKPDEAEALYRESLDIRRRALGNNSQEVAQGLNNLAKTLMQKNNYAEAEPLLRESLAIYVRLYGERAADTAVAMHNLAGLLYEKGDVANAEALFRQTLDIRKQKLPPGNAQITATMVGLGLVLSERGKAPEAEPLLREALENRRRDLAAGNWQIGDAASVLGGCLTALRRFDEAEPLLVEGYTTIKAKRGESDKQAARARARLLRLYSLWGKPDKAAAYRTTSTGK